MKLLRAIEVPGQPSAVFRESAGGKRAAFLVFSGAFLVLAAVVAGALGREASGPVLVFSSLGPRPP